MAEENQKSEKNMNRKAPSWTREQLQAIELKNRSLLVSAAAGSGKTAVLVERILRKITDPKTPLDIDRLLVVTFTNAAAAEMRERIGKALEKALEADPRNQHLQRQTTLLHNARITTIDSFCLSVVRDHFYLVKEPALEPGFRIADEGELTLMREDICDQVLEQYYAAKDQAFLDFADSYGTAKSDAPIREMILKLYDYAQSNPWPAEWLNNCEKQYEADSPEDLEQSPWMQRFLSDCHLRISEMCRNYESMREVCAAEDGPQGYENMVEDDLAQIMPLCQEQTFQGWKDRLASLNFKRKPALRKYSGSEEKKQLVSDARDHMKDQCKELMRNYFSMDLEEHHALMRKTGRMIQMLVKLTFSFLEAFSQEKSRKNMVDFSDVEHFALQILVDPVTKQPTSIAAEYRRQFAEIMVDEYQDSNYVQEELLTAVSQLPEGGENMFMMGDVKQSIYRFRLARPELFMYKFDTFSQEESSRQRVDLHKNFRSRPEVVQTVNDIFYHIMDKDLGNVAYDDAAALYVGAEVKDYGKDCCQSEFLLIPEDPDTEDRKSAEARAVAQRIRQMVEQEEIPGIRYQDIVLLLRSMAEWANVYQRVFEEEGIPLIVSSRTGYFAATEVQVILSFLRILDNPCQDIPLAAVMKSPIGGFTSSELARIKASAKDQTFYQAVLQQDVSCFEPVIRQKIQAFLELLNRFRERLCDTPIHRLLQEIYEDTGYRNYVTALPAGEQRRANLDMLMEKAIAYERTSFHGLFHFVRYIDRLMKYNVDYGEAELVGERENAVRLMSIHGSKGLEFPVVFVCGMGKQFHMQDSNSAMVFHPEYGVGLKYVDAHSRTKKDTLIRRIFSLETKKENLGEELRILYVALTRAREKLILAGSIKEAADFGGKTLPRDQKLDFSARMDAKCYWDLVLPALAACGDTYTPTIWDFGKRVAEEGHRQQKEQWDRARVEAELAKESLDMDQEICARLSWKYPHPMDLLPKQKVSVSELKHRQMEAFEEQLAEEMEYTLFPAEIPNPYVPKFVEETAENRGALYGTAMHRFMECFDFASMPTWTDWKKDQEMLRQILADWVRQGRIEEKEAQRVHLFSIYQLLIHPIAGRMAESARNGLLWKEQPFVMSQPAHQVWPETASGEPVLVQGIIDVFWEESDGFVLLDYKTDRVDSPAELVGRYQKQLELYAEAIERKYDGIPVKEIWIYSFRLQKCVSLRGDVLE